MPDTTDLHIPDEALRRLRAIDDCWVEDVDARLVLVPVVESALAAVAAERATLNSELRVDGIAGGAQ